MIDVLSPEYFDLFERRQSGPVYAVPTFSQSLNQACGDDGGGRGLARGWLVVLAGNPGFGKSLMALMLARDAIQAREKAAFISLEMPHGQLAARFYAMATGTRVHALEKGRFEPAVMQQVQLALRRTFPTGGLLTNDGILLTIRDVIREMTEMVEHGVKAFLIDYLQLIGIGDEESINRQVTEAITNLRLFAVQNQVLIVALSQFNRSTAGNYEVSPHVQGCHGGMIIDASADLALLLDHSRYTRDQRDPHIARTWLLLDKNRHGARREIPIEWDYRTLTVREAQPDEESLWPTHKAKTGR